MAVRGGLVDVAGYHLVLKLQPVLQTIIDVGHATILTTLKQFVAQDRTDSKIVVR